VKFAPNPSTLDVLAAILLGSVTLLPSSSALAPIAILCPLDSTDAGPLISTRIGCGVDARFTIFRETVPVLLSRGAMEQGLHLLRRARRRRLAIGSAASGRPAATPLVGLFRQAVFLSERSDLWVEAVQRKNGS
jgi:hypothetical protein